MKEKIKKFLRKVRANILMVPVGAVLLVLMLLIFACLFPWIALVLTLSVALFVGLSEGVMALSKWWIKMREKYKKDL